MSAGPSGKKDKNPRKKTLMEKYKEYLEQQKSASSASKKNDASPKKTREEKHTEPSDQETSADTSEEVEEEAPRKKTKEDKQREHIGRIEKTLIACVLGIITGVISFLVVNPSQILGFQSYTILALLIMIAGIVVQRHLFILLRIGSQKMGIKDWLYQGFMTFAFWFITWTLLLTQGA